MRRCEQSLFAAIERLIAERSDLMQLAAREHDVPLEQLSSAYGDWRPHDASPDLHHWLASENCPPRVHDHHAVGGRRQRLQDELADCRLDLQHNTDRLAEVVRQIDNLQRELAVAPIARRPIVDADRMTHLRGELAEVRRRLEWLDSLDGLRRERTRLTDELRRLEASGQKSESPLIACANHWLTRLTAGRLRSIELVNVDQVRIDGHRESDISSDDRRTAALALRMAVCCLMNENRTGIPIVIDDPVVHHHDHRSIARTLTEYAAGGNQVVVLTRSQPLVDDLADQGAWTDALPARRAVSGTAGSDTYDVNRYLDVAWRESNGIYDNPSHSPGASWNPSYNYPKRRTMRGQYQANHRPEVRGSYAADPDGGHGRHFLNPESHVDLAPSVDSVAAARLRGIGIESVGDLLTCNAANIASRIGLAGVDDRTIRRWQIESDLVCRVPGLRPFDARVLVGCGVSRPEHLAQLHPTELLEKVERFLSTDLGRETLRSGTSYELSRITTWIASASRAVLRGYGRDGGAVAQSGNWTSAPARRSTTTRRRTRRGEGTAAGNDLSTAEYQPVQRQASDYVYREHRDLDGDGIADETVEYGYDRDGNRISRRSRRSSRNGSSSRSQRSRSSRSSSRSTSSRSSGGSRRRSRTVRTSDKHDGYAHSDLQSREPRGTRTRTIRTSRTERSNSREPRSVVAMESSSRDKTLRYYLHVDAPVVDAPSIGPRMAERLEAVGIITVNDLLNADATQVASDLDHRRVSAETVQSWQLQSKLMCTSPMLRGHDAQLLVAAEITDVEQLAGCEASWLLDQVTPIARSSEGKRILRGAQKPDLAEVTDWITWAGQRHLVQAA